MFDKGLNVKVDVYLHNDEGKLEQILQGQKMVLGFLKTIFQQEKQIMATLDETLQAVKDENTIDQSLITLTTSIKAQLDAILAGGITPEAQAKVDAIFQGIQDNIAAVTAAVTANTPAA